MASLSLDHAYREAVRNWLKGEQWDIAASFLVPKRLMVHLELKCIRADEVTLSRELTYCFNRLDRKVFGSAHRRKKIRVPRFVALERTDKVGWHAHALLRTPEHITPYQLSSKLGRLWLHQLGKFGVGTFEDRLYWAEPVKADYFNYSTKHVGGHGAADWLNMVIHSPRGLSA